MLHDMRLIDMLIEGSLGAAWIGLLLSFALLAKCADLFVDSSVSLAVKLRIPKVVVGIVLVSFATTAPELAVSLSSALRGMPEMALGNALGSVICNAGLALALSGIVAGTAIAIIPGVLRTAGGFLALVSVMAFLFVLPDNTLGRWEGALLVLCFFGYLGVLLRQHLKGRFHAEADAEVQDHDLHTRSLAVMLVFFAAGLIGIILASNVIITSAGTIARAFNIPEGIIAMTLVALGTSIPEIATCVASVLKRHGAVAVGNILGAEIMNVCWVAGGSAMANRLTVTRKETLFMFPATLVFVAAMLILLRLGYRIDRKRGAVLLGLYALYLASFFVFFRPGG